MDKKISNYFNLLPHEDKITGKWIEVKGEVIGDYNTNRIEWLVSEKLAGIGEHKEYGAWDTLYIDPADSRLWVKWYPQGYLQGAGPPALRLISMEEAEKDFVITDNSKWPAKK